MTHTENVTVDTLNDMMDFGHIITVHADGTVTDAAADIYAPESAYVDVDADGYAPDEPYVDGNKWELLTGWTGQHGYHGACMHPSEFIGGGLAEHILTTPGTYVALVVEALGVSEGSDELVGWATARYIA